MKKIISSYQKEQLEAYMLICQYLSGISEQEREQLRQESTDYLFFRQEVDAFLSEYFGDICTQKCYKNQRSACCSREGIVTFFADTVINVLFSGNDEIQTLMTALKKPNTGFKCIYLGNHGCLWQIKPIVCEMFLCRPAVKEVFEKQAHLKKRWELLEKKRKRFTWPDRPVLFDRLERYFLDAGFSSSLMYMHNSPGLLRVKKMAGKNRKN